ncbi:cbb3-type cytochrome oxidase subunit 3 [Simiduia aestuariiviva]|uniref:Cytochrome c oxidase cbb3-type subunit 4 n=1 Tax=Simiduia aestuariiviva TaxID=1510459 RepID=A0A839UNN6_9GAMM|nr:cbb3-type cytochrome c oxidase subunit 3 [Simiduia aestuariiviva]MBB3169353.1 cytochrome c oxidase cbb3-type subunit 4 [Simiduia aestuariiviva]
MDINDLRSLGTVFVALAFIGVCWWAFSPKRKQRFEEAANLPFADEPQNKPTQQLHPDNDEERQD